MTYIFNHFWFDDGPRMTGIWSQPWPGDDSTRDLRELVSKGRLGRDQDGSVKCYFLSSHLPWTYGGIHGVDSGGHPWPVVIQIAPAAASGFVDSPAPWWVMVEGLAIALRFNYEVEVRTDIGLTADDLHQIYEIAGIDPQRIAEWTITELIQGPLAECANVPLCRCQR